MTQLTEEKKAELNSLVASITNRPYTESIFNLEREDTKVPAGGGLLNDFTMYPLSPDVIVAETGQEETAVLPVTSLAIDEEFSGLAVTVVGTQLTDSEGRLAELREEQLQWATQSTEARLQKYYLQKGLLALLPKCPNQQGKPGISSSSEENIDDRIRQARFHYDQLQAEIAQTLEAVFELRQLKAELEKGAVLPL